MTYFVHFFLTIPGILVSLIPSGFVKSSPFFPLAELTNIKGSADAGVEIDQGRIAEDF